MGRPICTVISSASWSFCFSRSANAFRTMIVRSVKEVSLHVLKASVAICGIWSNSVWLTPLRVRIGSLVVGEIVLIVSTDILTVEGGGNSINFKVN